jgi:hypothetical protein
MQLKEPEEPNVSRKCPDRDGSCISFCNLLAASQLCKSPATTETTETAVSARIRQICFATYRFAYGKHTRLKDEKHRVCSLRD